MPIKKIEGSATIKDIEDEIENEAVIKTPHSNKKLWSIIMILVIGLAVLSGIDWISSDAGQTILGFGIVNGSVINIQGSPVPAEIYLLTKDISTMADKDGSFSLENVPVGDQRLIIAWQGVGKEFPIKVEAGKTISLGQVIVEETQLPPEGTP